MPLNTEWAFALPFFLQQVKLAGGSTTRNLKLDGYDIWQSIAGGPGTPSPVRKTPVLRHFIL
jgi:hypothetical protein